MTITFTFDCEKPTYYIANEIISLQKLSKNYEKSL